LRRDGGKAEEEGEGGGGLHFDESMSCKWGDEGVMILIVKSGVLMKKQNRSKGVT
jgi:hypothetical protein